jgi:hypothetical protein
VSVSRDQEVGVSKEEEYLGRDIDIGVRRACSFVSGSSGKEYPSRLANIPSREAPRVRDSRRDSALPSLLSS